MVNVTPIVFNNRIDRKALQRRFRKLPKIRLRNAWMISCPSKLESPRGIQKVRTIPRRVLNTQFDRRV